MRAKLLCVLGLGLVIAAGGAACSDSPIYCSPCPPGTRASNPSVPCSACVAVDGGEDASVDG